MHRIVVLLICETDDRGQLIQLTDVSADKTEVQSVIMTFTSFQLLMVEFKLEVFFSVSWFDIT